MVAKLGSDNSWICCDESLDGRHVPVDRRAPKFPHIVVADFAGSNANRVTAKLQGVLAE